MFKYDSNDIIFGDMHSYFISYILLINQEGGIVGNYIANVFLLTVCVHVLSSSSRTSCHPAAADGLQRKLAQCAGAFFWPNGGANELSVSLF